MTKGHRHRTMGTEKLGSGGRGSLMEKLQHLSAQPVYCMWAEGTYILLHTEKERGLLEI